MRLGIHKILWAIDVAQKNEIIWNLSIKVIRELTKGTEIQLHPVYVLAPNQMNGPAMLLNKQIDLIQEAAEALLTETLRKIGIFVLNIMRPKILSIPIYTVRGATKSLHDYAIKIEADLILVGTHGRTGVPRLSMGSFAETLLLQSTIPLLIIGQYSSNINKFDHILFPSDFSKHSYTIFEQVLSFAEHMKSRITIAHILKEPSSTSIHLFPMKVGKNAQLHWFEQEKNKYRALAENFAKMSQKQGIPADVFLHTTSLLSVSDAILKVARTLEVAFIAMAAQSGAITSTLLGSTTREILRLAPCPVWVIHEKGFTKGQRHSIA